MLPKDGAIETPLFLGLDVGGSATRWCFGQSNSIASGESNGFSGHISNAEVLRKAQNALAQIASQTGPVDAIFAGVSGLSKNTPEADALSRLMQKTFGAKHIKLVSDIELATYAAFPDQNGILVYAGTGSIAAHLDGECNLLTAGGKGVVIDDAGGGYWIAVNAMRLVLRKEDAQPGSGWQSLLGQALAESLGGSDWPHVRTTFYGLDRGGIAMLALAVAKAAKAGDKGALQIFNDAGRELGALAKTLMIRTNCSNILLSGRASGLHPNIPQGMQEMLEGVTVKTTVLNCAETALNMAQHVHERARMTRTEHGND